MSLHASPLIYCFLQHSYPSLVLFTFIEMYALFIVFFYLHFGLILVCYELITYDYGLILPYLMLLAFFCYLLPSWIHCLCLKSLSHVFLMLFFFFFSHFFFIKAKRRKYYMISLFLLLAFLLNVTLDAQTKGECHRL